MKRFTVLLTLVGCSAMASAQPNTYLDLGIIGDEGLYRFSTADSWGFTEAIDTELAIWAENGSLLAENSDGGPFGETFGWSEISISLTAGVYYLGISEYLSIFAPDFQNFGFGFEPGEGGKLSLNIFGVPTGSITASDFSLFDEETAFFKVTVTPAPSAVALLGLGGIVTGRRRR